MFCFPFVCSGGIDTQKILRCGNTLFLSSPRFIFISGPIHGLCISRDDSFMDKEILMRIKQLLNVLNHRRAEGKGF